MTTKSQEAFELCLEKNYPHLSTAKNGKGSEFKYISMAVEGLWMSFEFGFNTGEAYGRKQELEEAATEIAELKAKLAEVMPLARFGAMVAKGDYLSDDDAIDLELKAGISIDTSGYKTLEYAPTIEATIEQLLKE